MTFSKVKLLYPQNQVAFLSAWIRFSSEEWIRKVTYQLSVSLPDNFWGSVVVASTQPSVVATSVTLKAITLRCLVERLRFKLTRLLLLDCMDSIIMLKERRRHEKKKSGQNILTNCIDLYLKYRSCKSSNGFPENSWALFSNFRVETFPDLVGWIEYVCRRSWKSELKSSSQFYL